LTVAIVAAVVAGVACDDVSRPLVPGAPDLTKLRSIRGVGARQSAPRDLASPVRLALSDRHTLFVADYLAGQVVEFRLKNGVARVRRSFPIDGLPLGIAAARKLLFVGNAEARSVEV
jgi:hypothetical protein